MKNIINHENQELMETALISLKKLAGIKYTLIDKIDNVYIGGEYFKDSVVLEINGHRFVCIIKKKLSNSNLNQTLQKLILIRGYIHYPSLLITHIIYPKWIDSCNEKKINILDSSGNCNLFYKNLFIRIIGQKNSNKKLITTPHINSASIILIFYFLYYRGSVSLPYRKIQYNTNISLRTIKNTFQKLTELGYLYKLNETRIIKNRKQLIDWWQIQYNTYLKPKLLLYTLSFKNDFDYKDWKNKTFPKDIFWGGDCGFHLKYKNNIPHNFEFYTNLPISQIMETGKFIMDKNGDIKVYKQFWKNKLLNFNTPRLIIYADLMGSADSRCLNAALEIKKDVLSKF